MKTEFSCGIAFVYKQQLLTIDNLSPKIIHNGSFVYIIAEFLGLELKIYPSSTQKSIIEYVEANQNEDYMELWCDHICNLIYLNKVHRQNDYCLVVQQIREDYYNYLKFFKRFKCSVLKEKYSSQNVRDVVVGQITGKGILQKNNTCKIFIINFSGSATREDKLSAKINIEALYAGIFYRNGEQWSAYKIIIDQIPTLAQLSQANLLMLSGSSLSVYNNNRYVQKFAQNMRQALYINKKLKVLGICFGHQLIAKIYNAGVERRFFVRGPQPITYAEQKFCSQVEYLSQLYKRQKKTVKMFQVHGDFVTQSPKGFLTIGSSPSCQVQSMISLDKRIFTVQFHPEYSPQYWKMLSFRWNNINYIKDNSLQSIEQSIDEQHYKCIKLFHSIVRKFIQWKQV